MNVRVWAGSQGASGSGRLSRTDGGGQWRGTGSMGNCAGDRWTRRSGADKRLVTRSDDAEKPAGRDIPRAFCFDRRAGYAALRLTDFSASAVSFWSAAFSSSRFFCSTAAQSLRPSCFAQATSVP